MIKEIIKDESILSQVCEPATAEDVEIAQDLLDTLENNEDAAGLAANQIGVTKCIIAYRDSKEEPHVMYNPKIKQAMAPFKAVEGCLSLEAESKVTRYERVKVMYDDIVNGEWKSRKRDLRGWEAQVVQHLVDHCKGKLI